jgi:hypothetical protein
MVARIIKLSLIWTMAACGGPLLQNAPKPDPGIVAGAAAAVAGAATLAAPDAAAKRQESAKRSDPDDRGVVVKETVPASAFDRLDQRTANDAGVSDAPPAPAPTPAAPSSTRTAKPKPLPRLVPPPDPQ